MEDQASLSTETSGADFGLIQQADIPFRMADGGPRYQETPGDPYSANAPTIAEPFNAASATLFIAIAMVWMWRIRHRFWDFPFLTCCLPVLLVGGIGGTLYHAFRTRTLYFYLDVVPISMLGLAGSAFLAVKLWKRKGYLYLLLASLGYVGFSMFFFLVLAPVFPGFRTLSVNATYAGLAIVILIPLVATLVQTQFRHWGLVMAALASFALAWFCRLIDGSSIVDLPMGTHWLWHLFGALTTWFMIAYIYEVERFENRPAKG